MNKNITKDTTAVVKKDDKIVGYLTAKHEEAGEDIKLDMAGYTIEAYEEDKHKKSH